MIKEYIRSSGNHIHYSSMISVLHTRTHELKDVNAFLQPHSMFAQRTVFVKKPLTQNITSQ